MNRLLFAGVIALVGAALLGGFLVAGGPGFARMVEEDRTRAQDLYQWGRYHACTADEGAPLTERCSGQSRPPESRDPATDQPYRYTRLDADTFEVCATFRTGALDDEPRYTDRALVFSGDEGCLRYRRNAGTGDWVAQ